jgi:hypothetical protein
VAIGQETQAAEGHRTILQYEGALCALGATVVILAIGDLILRDSQRKYHIMSSGKVLEQTEASITLDIRGERRTFVIDSNTLFCMNRTPRAPTKYKLGDQVSVTAALTPPDSPRVAGHVQSGPIYAQLGGKGDVYDWDCPKAESSPSSVSSAVSAPPNKPPRPKPPRPKAKDSPGGDKKLPKK